METRTFSEILAQKMKKVSNEKENLKKSENPMPEPVSSFSLEILSLRISPPLTPASRNLYPQSKTPSEKRKLRTPAPAPSAMESRVKKSSLDEISLGKWVRFEKMVGKNLGDSSSKGEVLKAFRQFLKRNHPDSAQAKAQNLDFALAVKIKNELLNVIK